MQDVTICDFLFIDEFMGIKIFIGIALKPLVHPSHPVVGNIVQL